MLRTSNFEKNSFKNSVSLYWTQQRLLDLVVDLQGTQQQTITWLSLVVTLIVFIVNLHMAREVEQQGSVLLVDTTLLTGDKDCFENIIIEISSVTEN